MSVHFTRLAAVLFPSWSFFTDESEKPELMHRWVSAEGESGPWNASLPRPERSWAGMFFSPEESLRYSIQSLVERTLLEDISAHPVSFQLIREAVRWCIRRSDVRVPPNSRLQFLIRVGAVGDGLVSEVFDFSGAEP